MLEERRRRPERQRRRPKRRRRRRPVRRRWRVKSPRMSGLRGSSLSKVVQWLSLLLLAFIE
jgi:hypothetical protein